MSHGFDNMADVLGISPALMEGYIRAAGKISREAVGDASALAHTTTYSVPRVTSQARHIEGTPLGTRGGISVVHDFPADGEYVFKMGFYYTPTGPLFGQNQGKGQQIEVAVNGERVGAVRHQSRDAVGEGRNQEPSDQSEGGSAANLGVVHRKSSTGRLRTSSRWWSRRWWISAPASYRE